MWPRRIGADPDVGPCRRDDQRSNAVELNAILHETAARIDIAGPLPRPDAADARHGDVVDVTKTGEFRGLERSDRLDPRPSPYRLSQAGADRFLDASLTSSQPLPGGRQVSHVFRSGQTGHSHPPSNSLSVRQTPFKSVVRLIRRAGRPEWNTMVPKVTRGVCTELQCRCSDRRAQAGRGGSELCQSLSPVIRRTRRWNVR